MTAAEQADGERQARSWLTNYLNESAPFAGAIARDASTRAAGSGR